jgi:FkbM family methyltransferase
MNIFYGIDTYKIDVTNICYNKLVKENIMIIPYGDGNRASFFSDPLFGTLKSIYIKIANDNNMIKYSDLTMICIDLGSNTIYTHIMPEYIYKIFPEIKLFNIQKELKLDYGTFNDELPEQLMAVKYLTGDEKVLEIGSNIGRNTLIIAHILNKMNNNNFVTLESDENIFKQLLHNKELNNLNFYAENSALSQRKLIQQGWNTMVSDILIPGWQNINTIKYDELMLKYNIIFDTLVLDCEGAFYYILMDMPFILDNIKLIIMENDYNDANHKNYIDDILKKNNFYVDYSQSGGWGCCYNNFFEVWKKAV